MIRNVIIRTESLADCRARNEALGRREFMAALLATPLLVSPRMVLAALGSSGDVARLKSFIAKTIGRTPGQRKEIARKTIDGINPLKESSKLLELAALGVLARESSVADALAEDLPGRSKRLITAVLNEQGDLGWAHALAGAWHYEVSRKSRTGAMVLGADRAEGEKRFASARAKAPGDTGIVLLEAITLIYDGAEKHSQRIADLLQKASAKAPKGAGKYEEVVARHALSLSGLATARQFKKLETTVRAVF